MTSALAHLLGVRPVLHYLPQHLALKAAAGGGLAEPEIEEVIKGDVNTGMLPTFNN